MAKSARASSIKKNRQALKRKVFGPVETARNERLNAKLLELASKAKPVREIEIEQDETTNPSEEASEDKTTADVDMDASTAGTAKSGPRSNRSYQRQKDAKVAKVEKRRVRQKPRNSITFKAHPMKAKGGKKR